MTLCKGRYLRRKRSFVTSPVFDRLFNESSCYSNQQNIMKRYMNADAVVGLHDRYPDVGETAARRARLLLGAGQEHHVTRIVNTVLLSLWERELRKDMPARPLEWA